MLKIQEIFNKIKNELYEKAFVDYDEYYSDNGECLVKFSDITNVIDQIEKEYNNGWISVNESLPKTDEIMWVTYIEDGKEKTANGYYIETNKCWYIGCHDYKTNDIIAWQPRPMPYKKKI